MIVNAQIETRASNGGWFIASSEAHALPCCIMLGSSFAVLAAAPAARERRGGGGSCPKKKKGEYLCAGVLVYGDRVCMHIAFQTSVHQEGSRSIITSPFPFLGSTLGISFPTLDDSPALLNPEIKNTHNRASEQERGSHRFLVEVSCRSSCRSPLTEPICLE